MTRSMFQSRFVRKEALKLANSGDLDSAYRVLLANKWVRKELQISNLATAEHYIQQALLADEVIRDWWNQSHGLIQRVSAKTSDGNFPFQVYPPRGSEISGRVEGICSFPVVLKGQNFVLAPIVDFTFDPNFSW